MTTKFFEMQDVKSKCHIYFISLHNEQAILRSLFITKLHDIIKH